MRKFTFVLFAALFLLPCPAPACSICGVRRLPLMQEFEQADAVVYGRIANPKLGDSPGRAGGGTTEFHVEKIVKNDPDLPKAKMVLLTRYLPILDAKDPPRYVMFFSAAKKNPQPYTGRQLSAPAVLDFVADLQRYRHDPFHMLLLAAKHFDDADPLIADEAFLVFARADDKLVSQVAKQVAPASLRKLLKTPNLEPERLSMFAYLLGACGNGGDVDVLRSLLKDTSARAYKSYEGILAGYITLRPQEGWAFAHAALKNDKTPFLLRYAAMRTMRFFYNADPKENGAQVMQGLGLAIAHADVSDIAITDLRKWQRWDHTQLIVSCYDKASHRAPIVQSSIVRYALACPMPKARALVERVRRQDPALVRDLEEEAK